MLRIAIAWVVAASFLCASPLAIAADLVTLAIGQRGHWDTAVAHLGEKAGLFRRQGIKLDIIYTSGSGETVQPGVLNSVDISIAAGMMGVLSAFAKGAPVRVIGAHATGAADYWYSKVGSGIRSLADAKGKTIAFSTFGSSTHSIVRAFIDEFELEAKAVPTGNSASTLIEVLTGHVDVGWAAPPFGLKELDEGKIQLVAKASDSKIVKEQTIRVIVTNKNALDKRRDVLVRFMNAYRQTIDYMYSSDAALRDYAEFANIPDPMARRVRDQFFPKSQLLPDHIKGLDNLISEAIKMKYLSRPLSQHERAELFQVPLTD